MLIIFNFLRTSRKKFVCSLYFSKIMTSFAVIINLNPTLMYAKRKDFLSTTLSEIREAGLYKEERLIESPQKAAISVKGGDVVNF